MRSSSATRGTTAFQRSGRCVIGTPLSSPPFEPPAKASVSRLVGDPGRDEVLGDSEEVGVSILLVLQPAALPPLQPEVRAATQMGVDEDAARGDEGRHGSGDRVVG